MAKTKKALTSYMIKKSMQENTTPRTETRFVLIRVGGERDQKPQS